MRNGLLVLLSAAMFAAPAFAFDVSPTQTPETIVRSGPVQASPRLVTSILSDDKLAKGVEQISLTDDGQSLSSLRGDLTDPASGDLESAARRFLVEHASTFNIPEGKGDDVAKLFRSEESANGFHFYYQMVLDGVRVHQAVIDLHFGNDHRLQLANGSFPTVKEISNQITISRIDAMAAAQRALGTKKTRATPKAELVVYPENNKGRMAYFVQMPSVNPLGDFDVLIDADTGKEISRQNQLVFADRATGQGSVYMSSPLGGDPVTQPLNYLSAHTLTGSWSDVMNDVAERASNDKDQHFYDPTNTHFDEVEMYFNLNRIHDFFHNKLGFTGRDQCMPAHVHFPDPNGGPGYDNAYYSPQEDAMCFGDGNKLNDLSKEAGVVWHEYSHAVLQKICAVNYSAESGAMNEGQADYFSCSLSNDPKLGAYAVQKMGKPWMRNLTDNLHYPENIQHEVHADGRIWGVCLWDLRTALGADTSDMLIHKSFSYLKPGSPKFSDCANAIIVADKNINGGKNKQAIMDVFRKRGITTGAKDGTVINGNDLRSMKLFHDAHAE